MSLDFSDDRSVTFDLDDRLLSTFQIVLKRVLKPCHGRDAAGARMSRELVGHFIAEAKTCVADGQISVESRIGKS